ncbi:MAG TPA: substrate-binding domain-containing protein [Acidimicrobiales bacterium]
MLFAISALASACGTNDGVKQSITMAGSDTTQDVMKALAAQYNADTGYNPDADDNQNVLAISLVTPDPGHTVPSDGVTPCPTRTYRTPTSVAGEVLRPNGSSAGRNALLLSVQAGDGCIDIARSSGPPRAVGTVPGTDLASFEYYAFGLDTLGITTASSHIPADHDITLNEVRGIFNCTITNWSQLGGTAGPIERYSPQTGSGTFQSFVAMLGFDPNTIVSCPINQTQENTGLTVHNNGDEQTAVEPYSVGNWVSMARGTTTDDRFGQAYLDLDDTSEPTLGFEIPVRLVGGKWEPRTPTASDPNGPVAEGNVPLNDPTPAYPAVRYVWNVIDNTTGANSYKAAKRFVGFDNVASPVVKSPLCNGDKASTLIDFGFGPLDATANPTHNIPGTHCRMWTP